ncbi:hypothetical protein HPB47_016971 [Ixodes persulcatus]|uniref:Uncharacterized protein n=1 Tax=Ixodes persulcatus TaxID=34615 RepID=A0AC60QPH6_IXOPE|nr:hypothetical protein HPB47_016971 [Ixodes persulcatus]
MEIDFGSANFLVMGEPSVAHVSSPHFRAPELVQCATACTTTVDVWSTVCVFVEFYIPRSVFPGENSLVQLFAIIRILGTPTDDQLVQMNPKWPLQEASCRLLKISRSRGKKSFSEKCFDGLAHVFFDELRLRSARLPDGVPFPQIDFSPEELQVNQFINH